MHDSNTSLEMSLSTIPHWPSMERTTAAAHLVGGASSAEVAGCQQEEAVILERLNSLSCWLTAISGTCMTARPAQRCA